MIYRCRHLVTMDGPPIEDGAVVVRGEFVAGAGTWAEVRGEFAGEAVEDLGDVTLSPGLVNAHCHLDYSTLRHAILPPTSFAEWVGRINALKRTMGPEDYLAAIAKGFREFAKWGTTTVLNIESFPELMWKMPAPPLRTWWFYELIDVRRVVATEEIVTGALVFFQQAALGRSKARRSREDPRSKARQGREDPRSRIQDPRPGRAGKIQDPRSKIQGRFKIQDPRPGRAGKIQDPGSRILDPGSREDPRVEEVGAGAWPGGTGLSPHAPYTASRELYRLARDCARHAGMPWTTHLGESHDERAMFVEGRGPLYDFLKGIGRPTEDCGHGRSALAQLTQAGCVGPECIAVHLNDWEEEDFALVEAGGALAGMTVVHCPRSHRYFRHTAFPWDALRRAEVNLCVATDSPASDGSFSLLEELRAAAESRPEVPAREWLEMVTLNPARALGMEGKLGVVKAGAWADLAAWPGGESRKSEVGSWKGEGGARSAETESGAAGNIYAEMLACRAPTVWRMVNGQVL